LSATVVGASPLEVLSIVILSILSKVSSLLALFLPIKIILLLGYDRIPKYFPSFFESVDRDTLIVSLSGLAIFFYVFYVLLEVVIERLESSGTKKLNEAVGNAPNFKKSKVVLGKLFKRVARSMTGLVFAISVAIFLAFIHLPLFLVVMLYSLCVFVVHELLFRSYKNALEDDEDNDDEQNNNKVKIWFDAGFLLAFVFIVWELMNDASISIITAFISFLLLRKSSGDLKRLAGDISFLGKQKVKVSEMISQRISRK
jgi:hypothetical protein